MDREQNKLATEPANHMIKEGDPEFVSTMVPISAGKERIRCLLSSIPSHARPAGWRVVMDFDECGDLTSYLECSCDEYGNERAGGGIERIENGPSRAQWCAVQLSTKEIQA